MFSKPLLRLVYGQGRGAIPRLALEGGCRRRGLSVSMSWMAAREDTAVIAGVAKATNSGAKKQVPIARLQTTDTVLMVEPTYFDYNPATAGDNLYQSHLNHLSGLEVRDLAMQEFDSLVALLRQYGVRVIIQSPLEEHVDCSDAVFPNNWVSFHEGRIVVYPMMAENRRKERRMDLVKKFCEELSVDVVDYTLWETEGKFLEGTGSMVLDRENKICYACLSQRTDPVVLEQFCQDFDYQSVTFEASQTAPDGQLWPVYHTNVMCSIGDTFAMLCSESIRDPIQRDKVIDSMTSTGKEVIDVKEKQVYQFAGNTLQLRSQSGKRLLVMSTRAYKSLHSHQRSALLRHVHHILHVPLVVIETLGGGGARCMIAEVFYNYTA